MAVSVNAFVNTYICHFSSGNSLASYELGPYHQDPETTSWKDGTRKEKEATFFAVVDIGFTPFFLVFRHNDNGCLPSLSFSLLSLSLCER